MSGEFAYICPGGNIGVGLNGDQLILRVGVEGADEQLKVQAGLPMNFSGHVMRGSVAAHRVAIQSRYGVYV